MYPGYMATGSAIATVNRFRPGVEDTPADAGRSGYANGPQRSGKAACRLAAPIAGPSAPLVKGAGLSDRLLR